MYIKFKLRDKLRFKTRVLVGLQEFTNLYGFFFHCSFMKRNNFPVRDHGNFLCVEFCADAMISDSMTILNRETYQFTSGI